MGGGRLPRPASHAIHPVCLLVVWGIERGRDGPWQRDASLLTSVSRRPVRTSHRSRWLVIINPLPEGGICRAVSSTAYRIGLGWHPVTRLPRDSSAVAYPLTATTGGRSCGGAGASSPSAGRAFVSRACRPAARGRIGIVLCTILFPLGLLAGGFSFADASIAGFFFFSIVNLSACLALPV